MYELYELHVICGVNPSVTKGTRSDLKKLDKSGLSHINFWATPEGPNSAGTAPVLFFAEFSNGEEDGECFPVLASSIGAVRCFHCEHHGIKIVHPYNESYQGGLRQHQQWRPHQCRRFQCWYNVQVEGGLDLFWYQHGRQDCSDESHWWLGPEMRRWEGIIYWYAAAWLTVNECHLPCHSVSPGLLAPKMMQNRG